MWSSLTYIWIPEYESLVQLILHPIHLAADNAEQRLAVNQDLDAVLFYRLIEFSRFIHVLEMIRQARTTPVLHSHSYELRFRKCEEFVEMVYCGGGERHGCLARAKFGSALWFLC